MSNDASPVQLRDYYTMPEVAELLGYPPQHIRRIVAQGKLPAEKLPNGRRRISHAAVMQWVAEHGSALSYVLRHRDDELNLV
ncbi:MAG: hypothetical protein CL902_00025 [Dehalococcoidia bacterium]|nr:hypothetical protein [Dehalococcoidia bacterium]